jgi:hypothetical protein
MFFPSMNILGTLVRSVICAPNPYHRPGTFVVTQGTFLVTQGTILMTQGTLGVTQGTFIVTQGTFLVPPSTNANLRKTMHRINFDTRMVRFYIYIDLKMYRINRNRGANPP